MTKVKGNPNNPNKRFAYAINQLIHKIILILEYAYSSCHHCITTDVNQQVILDPTNDTSDTLKLRNLNYYCGLMEI